ncbi:uncharacterized protein LOC120249347 [Dioscorea cayenensis subsp. rotundata]|uniref:Uncharacterized protein LOC120249347 n=1 Tax=Dioscorea cayennensis subsp. rotundata TaxID=55577 RepID=A0AB40AG16_DIOCR|nr:uncharacterized protein LOC120249347 [Dioscorea cayenensis subsp. rotundata]
MIHNGASTFFWYDNWIGGWAPKDISPDLFNICQTSWITIRQLYLNISNLESFFLEASPDDFISLIQSIPNCSSSEEDTNIWTLDRNHTFSVRSFYKFLVDGGLRTPLYPSFWKVECPSKVTLFCWLANDNKISTLSNLGKKGCNFQNATYTCVMCYKNSETVDHLLIHCDFASRIWAYYLNVLNSHSSPNSLDQVWLSWIPSLDASRRPLWDLLTRAILWNIRLERNRRVFNLTFLPISSVIFKISNMLIDWCSAARDSTQQISSDNLQSVKRSLDFMSVRSADLASSSIFPRLGVTLLTDLS